MCREGERKGEGEASHLQAPILSLLHFSYQLEQVEREFMEN